MATESHPGMCPVWRFHTRPYLVALSMAVAVLLPPASCAGQPMRAYFVKKDMKFTDTFETGPAGGTFRVPIRGTPTDGVLLQLPETSVDRPIRLAIGYCTGKTKLSAGTPSGVVLVIRSDPESTFQHPLRICVSFLPNPKHMTLVGYAIDQEGRFRPIDEVDLDMKLGRVSFLTFQPLTLTWAYVDR